MNSFLENSTLIFANITELKNIVNSMQEFISLKQTSVMTEEQENVVDGKIEELDCNFDKICVSIKDAIKVAQEETNELKKHKSIDKAEIEMRNLHTHKFFKELKYTIFNYRNLKSEFKNKEKDLLKQAYQIVNPKADDASLDKIINEPDSDTALNSAFSLGGNSAKQMLQTAKNRRKKIDKIIEIINRLVALIEEIDNIVKASTTVVDDIVINMTQSEKHTQQANKELKQSIEYQRKVNFFKRLFLGFICMIVVIFLIYLATKYNSNKPTAIYYNNGGNP